MQTKNKIVDNDFNPFIYEAANYLSPDEIIDYYIEDFNYSRFLQSPRNIFLIGERGTGKTMTLRYNSLKIQYEKAKRENKTYSFENVGIHVPCKTPLFEKNEFHLFDDKIEAHVLSEHYLVLSIVSAICLTLLKIPEIEKSSKNLDKELKRDMEYLLSIKLPIKESFIRAVSQFVEKESIDTQAVSNSLGKIKLYKKSFSFSSLVLPFIKNLKQIPILSKSHFSLMLDDAHDLNEYQIKSLNSWISFRDHSDFSFKVAMAKVNSPHRITSSGNSILEGHDYTSIEMEKYFYNKNSDYAKMAKKVLKKRLEKININTSVDQFFPINPALLKGLEESEKKVRSEAEKLYKNPKQVYSHVYKYGRAEYFRQRNHKANRPPYSGIETIIDISTGVIRNLLEPCFSMYDYELSNSSKKPIKKIPYQTQTKIILSKSDDAWIKLQETGLDKEIEKCSPKQAKQIFQFFDNLMILLRHRLLNHKSLPRAIEFYISERTNELMNKIQPLLDIAQKAQLLYIRIGSSKDQGRKEIYYIPNRILLPSRGLDPQGQHDRAGLKAIDVYNAAFENKKFPTREKNKVSQNQVELF